MPAPKNDNLRLIEWHECRFKAWGDDIFGHIDHFPVQLLGVEGSGWVVQNINSRATVTECVDLISERAGTGLLIGDRWYLFPCVLSKGVAPGSLERNDKDELVLEIGQCEVKKTP